MASRLALLAAALTLAACGSSRRVYDVTQVDQPPEVTGDSLATERAAARLTYVEADDEGARPDVAPDRQVDLLHTALDVRLAIPERAVYGTATHRLTSLTNELKGFTLHAVGMEIARVTGAGGRTLEYAYDGRQLTIVPAQPLDRDDTVTVEIEYVARPMADTSAGGGLFGGYGMYFIDPEGTDPYRPTQVWTQGQAEDNRRWFPTWDYPNDKMTFEVALTVPDSLRTFSNGRLAGQTEPERGMRRDHWVLGDIPQPAYLAVAVAGDFAAVEDTYRRADGSTVPLVYIVEPRFEDDARRIFGETPAMMAAFEAYTGTPYPWPNYKQVAVRDFTAGGMENTTLTVMYEGIQTDERAFLTMEDDLRDLISHELAHQWFGDYTTTEDWANITINEGFATHLEEVYREAAFGRDAAQDRVLRDLVAYLGTSRTSRRPIVWYNYQNPGQMFDTHTYQKGGLVWHMLHFELGDEVFRRGLRRFFAEHGGRAVEVEDLRQAMEEESGRSLRRFFDQWFYRPGHPALTVEQAFFPGSSLYTVHVVQTQDPANEPVFHFDANIELNFPSAERQLHRVRVMSADTTFRFTVPERPTFVRFDEGQHVLADVTYRVPEEELVAQATTDDEMAGRFVAVDALGARPASPAVREALLAAVGDDHPTVRQNAIAELGRTYLRSPGVVEALAARGTDDPDADTREAAFFRLAELPPDSARASLEPALREGLRDRSWIVIARAVAVYARLFPRTAYDAYEAADLFSVASWQGVVEEALVEALGTLSDPRGMAYLTARTGPMNPDDVREAATRALGGLAAAHEDLRAETRLTLRNLLADRQDEVRIEAARGLGRIGTTEDLDALEARRAIEAEEAVQEALTEAASQIRARGEGGTVIGNPR
ncbi:MAG TPA: M1 family aminopeptidase [Rubricoccaceae bacterium]|nr:M1 family aminopeptidase [Rubricoccaceae bacterium]